MAFQTLTLTHLRNHRAQTFALAPRAQAFVGPNGAGKTTVLEAAHYLALARGFGHDRDALTHGEQYFQLDGVWLEGAQPLRVTCGYQAGRGRRILYDGEALRRLADHVGRIPVVAIVPDDVELVTGPAAGRRRWLDALLSQADASYLEALVHYEHALAQLNALYQAAADSGQRPDPEQLELWEGPVVHYGQPLRQARAAFLGPFATQVEALYAAVAPLSGVATDERIALSDLTAAHPGADWRAALLAERPRAAALGRLRWGPHRDDVGFALSGRPLQGTGSQGQLKTFVIAIKLAQRAYLAQATGRPPLLLLDDVFERLDAHRAERLFALLAADTVSGGGQVLITDTDPARVQRALAAFGADGTAVTTIG